MTGPVAIPSVWQMPSWPPSPRPSRGRGQLARTVAKMLPPQPSFETFLKAHAGDPIMVDRVGRPSETILDPALALADLGLDESLAVAYR